MQAACVIKNFLDFPGVSVVKNPPSIAGNMGLFPVRGTKILYAAGQLNCVLQLRPYTAKEINIKKNFFF